MSKTCYVYYTNPEGARPNFVYSKEPMNEDIVKFLDFYKEKSKMLSFSVEENFEWTRESVESHLLKNINYFVPPVLSSEIIDIYIDFDDTIFDFMGAVEKKKNQTGMTYPQAEYGFFDNLEPLPRAVEVVKKLIEDPRYNVRFATAPSVYNPMSYTGKRMSVEKHFGFEMVDKMILISEKDLLDNISKGVRSILIDDIREGYGQEKFTEQIVFGSVDCPDWTAIEKLLIDNDYF
tara:strand:+ start:289 stop:990 length:702 start_codon:yes stop_codon:yes gene_type:complete